MSSSAELRERLAAAAKSAAAGAGLVPDVSAEKRLAQLVEQAAETLGSDAGPEETASAEMAFARLAATIAGTIEPAGAGMGMGVEERGAEARRQPIEIGEQEIQHALDGLCPGFFPFC